MSIFAGFSRNSFAKEFLNAQKQYPQYFEALLNKFLTNPIQEQPPSHSTPIESR
jgi:hypothetical protein